MTIKLPLQRYKVVGSPLSSYAVTTAMTDDINGLALGRDVAQLEAAYAELEAERDGLRAILSAIIADEKAWDISQWESGDTLLKLPQELRAKIQKAIECQT